MSLPADTVLLVKEHPWMIGKRSLPAYRKMLEIPRVHLVDPALTARTFVEHAALVAVVTGSVALEAAMMRKPVIVFGDCPFTLLPPHMVRRCSEPRVLPALLRDLMSDPRSDDAALERYVAAVMDTSARVQLYSVLLGKQNVHIERPSEYQQELDKLAHYLIEKLASPAPGPAPGAAAW
jgi:hypothetical protein